MQSAQSPIEILRSMGVEYFEESGAAKDWDGWVTDAQDLFLYRERRCVLQIRSGWSAYDLGVRAEDIDRWWPLLRRCRRGHVSHFPFAVHLVPEPDGALVPGLRTYLAKTALCSARSLPQLPACLIKRLPPELVREIVRALFG